MDGQFGPSAIHWLFVTTGQALCSNFTEQGVIEEVLVGESFREHIQHKPQYWFDNYSEGCSEQLKDTANEDGISTEHERGIDHLVHFSENGKE